MKRHTLLSAMTAVGLVLAGAAPALAQTLRVMSWEPSYVEGNDWWDELIDRLRGRASRREGRGQLRRRSTST